jgi:hypothetical protein
MLTTILTQALVVFVLMFSPLNFPARAPARLVARGPRGPVDPGDGRSHPGHAGVDVVCPARGSFVLLGAWCLAGFAVAFLTLNRRG